MKSEVQPDRDQRIDQVFRNHLAGLQILTDRLFAWLLIGQWLFVVCCSIWISPKSWDGNEASIHIHVWAAAVIGGLLVSLPLALVVWFPHNSLNRFVNASSQMLFSALLIHLMGGRIEAHFHIFGSLAILAFYRDAKVFIPAVGLVLLDHLGRGLFWPESVFGVEAAAPWRALEHGGWVFFETGFLLRGVAQSRSHLRSMAALQVYLTDEKQQLEIRVDQRVKEQAKLQIQLAQAQKLESIGSLAAGISHEINTPMQCVSSNVEFLKSCSERIFTVLDRYKEMLYSDDEANRQTRIASIDALTTSLRFDHVCQQVPEAIAEAAVATERVIEIVRVMKAMSHPGTKAKVSTDINVMVHNAVKISKSRWKYAARVELDLAQSLPDVKALPAEFGQVMLNLIVNAADAIAEKNGDSAGRLGLITIRTFSVNAGVMIEVSDDGGGIPEGIRQQIFDPFFTTKDVGKGTGQGLAITYDIVVNKHNGTVSLESQVGVGTTFMIWLPCEPVGKSESDKFQDKSDFQFEHSERGHCDAEAIVC